MLAHAGMIMLKNKNWSSSEILKSDPEHVLILHACCWVHNKVLYCCRMLQRLVQNSKYSNYLNLMILMILILTDVLNLNWSAKLTNKGPSWSKAQTVFSGVGSSQFLHHVHLRSLGSCNFFGQVRKEAFHIFGLRLATKSKSGHLAASAFSKT